MADNHVVQRSTAWRDCKWKPHWPCPLTTIVMRLYQSWVSELRKLMAVLFLCIVTSGCETESSRQHEVSGVNRPQIGDANQAQERRIRELIQQLVFADRPANNQHVVNPNMKIVVDGTSTTVGGESEDADKRRQRFNVCLEAFNELYEMKPLAIPYLVEHLDDERQSIDFRNHYVGNSVGDACYWNIYYQLVDQPEDYSEYGWQREGRDGKDHPKPYWEGTPFGDLGDSEALKQWLKENRNLSYEEMQIKCLQWLLDRERLIGALDADSYFLNILPLEIRILELRAENVQQELDRLVKIRDERLTDQIPKNMSYRNVKFE